MCKRSNEMNEELGGKEARSEILRNRLLGEEL